MKVKDLIKKLNDVNPDAKILVSSDEELNTLYEDIEIAYLSEVKSPTIVVWGNSTSIIDESEFDFEIKE